MTQSGPRRTSFLAVLFFVWPAAAMAQAWTPGRGDGTVWTHVQMLHADSHLRGDGIKADDVDIRANSLTFGLEYGLTDRLALGVSVPYVRTRFISGEFHGGTIDDGETRGTWTDAHLQLRYKAIHGRFVLTPTIAASIPTRSYATHGHSAPGRGVHEYSAGFDAGYHAITINPSLFLGGGFQHTYVERIDDITVDRSNAQVRADYVLTSRFVVSASALWQKTHGGLNLPLQPEQRPEHGTHHDQLAQADFWAASAGLGFALTPKLDLYASWSTVLDGVNTHQYRAWTGGVAWHFDRR